MHTLESGQEFNQVSAILVVDLAFAIHQCKNPNYSIFMNFKHSKIQFLICQSTSLLSLIPILTSQIPKFKISNFFSIFSLNYLTTFPIIG